MCWIDKVLDVSESLSLDDALDRATLKERLQAALPMGELVGIIRESLRDQMRAEFGAPESKRGAGDESYNESLHAAAGNIAQGILLALAPDA